MAVQMLTRRRFLGFIGGLPITAGGVHRAWTQTHARVVVVGGRRWPHGVTGAAGRRLAPLLDHAVFLPRHRPVETGGVTGDLLPRPLLGAVTPLLQDWQLLDHPRKGRR